MVITGLAIGLFMFVALSPTGGVHQLYVYGAVPVPMDTTASNCADWVIHA